MTTPSSRPEGPDAPRAEKSEVDPSVPELVRRLADAEAALRAALAADIDAIVLPEGHTYLLADAQQALVASEARTRKQAAVLEAVLTSAPDYIAHVSLDGTILFVNRGLPPLGRECLVGTPWLSYAPSEHRASLKEVFDSVVATGTTREHEGYGQGPDGTVVWYSRRLGPVRLGDDIVGVVVITGDVSEHHRMVEETREARAFAESILSTVREPLVVLDGDLRLVSANRSFLTTFQVASEEAEGRRLGELAGGQWDTPDLRKVLTSILPKQAEVSNYELVHDVPSLGKRAMLLHGRRVHRPEGAPELMLLSFQDVTDRDERIRLTERQRRLEAANEELDAFAHSVSHDLRAPLRAIDGFSRAIAEDCGDRLPNEAREHLARVGRNVERMQRLIEELLSFSRLAGTVPKSRPVNMRALAESVLEDRLASERGRTIDVEVQDLPEAQCDPDLLRQVWDNLASNAIKYTRRRERALVRVSGRVEDQELVYTVEDNGAGFDMQYAGRLFGVFQRFHTDAQFEGVGVGLSLVRRIVARHGGRVWADATPDVGAKFSFALPK